MNSFQTLRKAVSCLTLVSIFFMSSASTAMATVSRGTQVDVEMGSSVDAADSYESIEDMIVTASGDLHIVTKSDTNGTLTYIQFDGTNWSSTEVDDNIEEGANASIGVLAADEDQIGIAWAEYDSGTGDTTLYYSYSQDGGDTFTSPETIYDGAYGVKRGRPGLLIGSGVLYSRVIACTEDTVDLIELKRSPPLNPVWVQQDTFTHADVDCKDVRYFEVDGVENAILGPSNDGDDGVDHVTNGVSWSLVDGDIVDNISSNSEGQRIEVAVDYNDNISFVVADNESTGNSDTIHFASYNGSTWTTDTVATGVDIGQGTHGIAVDPNGYNWVSYYDLSRNDLILSMYDADGDQWNEMDANSATLSIDSTTDYHSDSRMLYHPVDQQLVIGGHWLESLPPPSAVTDIDKFTITDLPGWYQYSKETTSGAVLGDNLGMDVAISTGTDGYNYAIAGAPQNLVTGGAEGKAIIYKEETDADFNEVATLTASDAADYDRFGDSVAIDGDYAVVGAPDESSSKGAAYVFKRTNNTWAEQAKLTASDGATNDDFGRDVSISGDYVVVGAPDDDNANGTNAGSAYVFKRDGVNWTEKDQLIASYATGNDELGTAVSVDGDYIAVGAPYYDNGNKGGAVFVFNTTDSGENWSEQDDLILPGYEGADHFGKSLDLEGSYLIVGAPNHDYLSTNSAGLAVVFTRSGSVWSDQANIPSPNPTTGYAFGKDVALASSGSIAMISEEASANGIVRFYGRVGAAWSVSREEIQSIPNYLNGYGANIDMISDRAVVGALVDNGNKGAMYALGENSETLQQAGGGGGEVPEFKTYIYLITLVFGVALIKNQMKLELQS